MFASLMSCGGGGSSSGSGASTANHSASSTAELTTAGLDINNYAMQSLPFGLITYATSPYIIYNAGGDFLALTISNFSCTTVVNAVTVPCSTAVPLVTPPTVGGTVTSIQQTTLLHNPLMQINGLNLSASTLVNTLYSGSELDVWKFIATNSNGLSIQNAGLTITCPTSSANPPNIEPNALTTASANTNLATYINTCLP